MRMRWITMWAVVNIKTGRVAGDVSRYKCNARYSASLDTGYTTPSERELLAAGFKTVQVRVCDLQVTLPKEPK